MNPCSEQNPVVLFQGDSITDCGRDYANGASLGEGYAMMVAAWHAARNPSDRTVFLNRGISGNRAKDLAARWQKDCIDLKPTVVSIFIGINDTWRRYDSNDPTSTEAFEQAYRGIAGRVRDELGAHLVVLEPFVLPVPPDRRAWREDLDPKIQAARRIATEFGATYVPLDGLFAAVAARRDAAFWSPDGVHPSSAGHALIAQAWLDAVELGE